MKDNNKMYTVKQVADFLELHFTKVYKLIELKKIGAIDISTEKDSPSDLVHRPNWRISKISLDKFMEERKNG